MIDSFRRKETTHNVEIFDLWDIPFIMRSVIDISTAVERAKSVIEIIQSDVIGINYVCPIKCPNRQLKALSTGIVCSIEMKMFQLACMSCVSWMWVKCWAFYPLG